MLRPRLGIGSGNFQNGLSLQKIVLEAGLNHFFARIQRTTHLAQRIGLNYFYVKSLQNAPAVHQLEDDYLNPSIPVLFILL